jgi:KUP system potassium uptake protein
MKERSNKSLLQMMIASIGVVYGDIGTSPLYALKSCFILTDLPVNSTNVLGLISLFIWLLILVVNFKYLSIVMKCDQQGEGGTLVLSSICKKLKIGKFKKLAFILGIIAMGLFVGESVITPAISVLSAVEGLRLVVDIPDNIIIICAILVLGCLFLFQNKGSGYIGKSFGYVMMLWFIVIAALGLFSIIKNPEILAAFNPYYAVKFLFTNGMIGWMALGGAILVITGVEALYADMGHFSREIIEKSWIRFVLPALILNYLGQGALLISDAQAIVNPFYLLAPKILIYPLVILSVMATIIASQAVISGLFSLSWQAILLHYLPRMKVIHTSYNQRGQIYLPLMNYLLLALTVMAVLIFKDSEALASAYGLSVSSVMLISTMLIMVFAYYKLRWSILKISFLLVPLLALDIVFVTTNLLKVFEGAWYTLMLSGTVIYIILTWVRGNEAFKHYKREDRQDIDQYIEQQLAKYKTRIPGCAIFMSRFDDVVPHSLEVQLKHNKYLHEKLLFLVIITGEEPIVKSPEKFSYKEFKPNVFSITVRSGFREIPDVCKIIEWMKSEKIIDKHEDISVFLGRGLPIASRHAYLSGMSEKIYILLSKNASPAYEFFKIDSSQVIELGIRYEV